MTVILDLFQRRARWYYWGLAITIITMLFISIAAYYNLQFDSPLMPLYDTLLIICILTSVAFITLALTGVVRTYEKNGEVTLTDSYLIIDGVTLQLNEIKMMNLALRVRTKKSFILISNRMEVIDQNDNIYKHRVAIKSYNQNEQFEKIIELWKASGTVINISYHNI